MILPPIDWPLIGSFGSYLVFLGCLTCFYFLTFWQKVKRRRRRKKVSHFSSFPFFFIMENLNKLVLWYLVKPQKKRKDENDDEQDEDELVASEDVSLKRARKKNLKLDGILNLLYHKSSLVEFNRIFHFIFQTPVYTYYIYYTIYLINFHHDNHFHLTFSLAFPPTLFLSLEFSSCFSFISMIEQFWSLSTFYSTCNHLTKGQEQKKMFETFQVKMDIFFMMSEEMKKMLWKQASNLILKIPQAE